MHWRVRRRRSLVGSVLAPGHSWEARYLSCANCQKPSHRAVRCAVPHMCNDRESAACAHEVTRQSGSRLWASLQDSCSVIWHVHIPKTGGTSAVEALRKSPAYILDHYPSGSFGKRGDYIRHGGSSFWSLAAGNALQPPDLLRRSREHHAPPWTLLSVEVGVGDLTRIGYPYFNSTCFLAVMRDPREWVLSAENHMRQTSLYRGGLRGRWGYFDQLNIQSEMVGYAPRRSHNWSNPRSSRLPADDQPLLTCVATLEAFETSILPHLFRGQSPAPQMPHANARPHTTAELNISTELSAVLEQRYALDSELWAVVRRQQMLCW